jgi:Right handed beta helix region
LPATITSSGVYCLKSNRSMTQEVFAAIEIRVNNVVIDLNGFRLSGRGTADSHAFGIWCSGCRNVTVKNGTVQGFAYGIGLGTQGVADLPTTSWANVIEDIRAVRNTIIGIFAGGHGVIVRNNHIVFTGPTTVGSEATGIQIWGTGGRVIGNDIMTVRQGGAGIQFVTDARSGHPPDNLAINNRITHADVGIRYLESAGKFRDNMTSSVARPYIGGTDAGNNY